MRSTSRRTVGDSRIVVGKTSVRSPFARPWSRTARSLQRTIANRFDYEDFEEGREKGGIGRGLAVTFQRRPTHLPPGFDCHGR